MGKCGCGLFKIHKKKVIALLRVITKVFLLGDTNVSKMGRNLVSSAERKSCKCQWKCQLNRVSPEEEELKSNDTTSVVALGTGTPDMSIQGYELESYSDC